MITATMNEVQQALDRLQVERQTSVRSVKDSVSMRSADRGSLRTRGDEGSDEDDTGPINGHGTSSNDGMGSNHRAALAAKAVANAEKAAQEAAARAEQRRQDDVAAYEKARSEGLVDGLQMSDESSEEEELPLPVGMKSTLARPGPEAVELPASPTVDTASPSLSAASPLIIVDGHSSADEMGRPRAGTVSSGYAESSYSTQSVQPAPTAQDAQVLAAATEAPLDADDAQEELNEDATVAHPNGESALDATKHIAVEAVEAVGAGVIGVAAAAAAVVGLNVHPNSAEPTAVDASFPKEVDPVTAQPALAPVEDPIIPSHTITAPSPVVPPPASPPAADRALTPPLIAQAPEISPSSIKPIPAPLVTSAKAMSASPAASLTSAIHSRSSSRLGAAPLTGGSLATSDTSPHGSVAGRSRPLPHDPLAWSVEDVVEWGRGKGFDNLTLSKFQGVFRFLIYHQSRS